MPNGTRRASAIASALFPAPVGPVITRSLTPAKASLELVPGQLHDGRPAVYVVRRQRRAREGRVERAHLVGRERVAGLDRGLARERGGEMLVTRRRRWRPVPGERGERVAQAARRIEAWVRHGDGADDERVSAESFDLEAEALEQGAMLIECIAFGGSQVERDGKEQPL